jgi:uncharacterized protein (DUF983 family)
MTSNNQMATRDKWLAVKRGFNERCPACGEGNIFYAYLKVADACPKCGEELHHHRADDAPPYFTILVVGHLIGAGMLWVEESNDAIPLWIHALIWPALTLALCLLLLPRFKGALIGYQWALRMHGFEGLHPDAAATTPATAVAAPVT